MPMTCEQAENLMARVIHRDPDLPEDVRLRFVAHTVTCEQCQQGFEDTKIIIGLLHSQAPRLREAGLFEDISAAGVYGDREAPGSSRAVMQPDLRFASPKLAALWREHVAQQASQPWPVVGDKPIAVEIDTSPSADVGPVNGRVARAAPPSIYEDGTPCRKMVLVVRWWSAAAACLVLLLGAAWLAVQTGSSPSAPTAGEYSEPGPHIVELVASDGRQSLALGEPLASGHDRLEVMLGNQHRVVLNTDTTASFHALPGMEHAYAVDLSEGEVYVEVVPGHPFEVRTAHAWAQVTGTRFSVHVQDEATELVVAEGGVRLSARDEASHWVDVAADQAASVAAGHLPSTRRSVDAQSRTAWTRASQSEYFAMHEAWSPHGDLEDLMNQAWLQPRELNLDALDYEAWRKEQRGWFIKQFPWAVKLEQIVRDEHELDVRLSGGADARGLWMDRSLEVERES